MKIFWSQCGKEVRERIRVDVNKLVIADVHMRYVDRWTMIKVSLKKEWQEGDQVVLEARGLSDGFIGYERM